MGVFPPFLLENILIGSTHTMSPLTYKEFECRAGMSNWGTWKAWAASWPFASGRPWAFGGGGGGASEKNKKKEKKNGGLQRPPLFFFCHPPSPSPSVLFAYSFALPPSPLLLPYQETPDCHALPPPHEPPYPQKRWWPLEPTFFFFFFFRSPLPPPPKAQGLPEAKGQEAAQAFKVPQLLMSARHSICTNPIPPITSKCLPTWHIEGGR